MDKAINLPLKDFLIRKLAVKLMRNEDEIEKIISHQYQAANEALLTNDSIEISGFGKFFFNHKKALKCLNDLSKIEESVEKRLATCTEKHKAYWEFKKRATKDFKTDLTKKLYGTTSTNN